MTRSSVNAARSIAIVAVCLIGSVSPNRESQHRCQDSKAEPQSTCPTATKNGQQGSVEKRQSAQTVSDDRVCDGNRRDESKKKYAFQKHGGIVYSRGKDYELTCDVYQPKGEGPFPGVIAIHGGGWFSGAKWHMIRHARALARAGYTVVAINYRHAPQHPFPAQLLDCRAAVRWMRENAETYSIDPKRIGGFGYSAGGHLVALLGTVDDDDDWLKKHGEGKSKFSARIQACSCGGTPFEFDWVSDRSLVYWLKKTKSAAPERYLRASPLHYVSKGDAPFFLFHGVDDQLVPTSSPQKMKLLLQRTGIDVEYLKVESGSHLGTFSSMQGIAETIEFFEKKLKIR